jgi:hypothetical protein
MQIKKFGLSSSKVGYLSMIPMQKYLVKTAK